MILVIAFILLCVGLLFCAIGIGCKGLASRGVIIVIISIVLLISPIAIPNIMPQLVEKKEKIGIVYEIYGCQDNYGYKVSGSFTLGSGRMISQSAGFFSFLTKKNGNFEIVTFPSENCPIIEKDGLINRGYLMQRVVSYRYKQWWAIFLFAGDPELDDVYYYILVPRGTIKKDFGIDLK